MVEYLDYLGQRRKEETPIDFPMAAWHVRFNQDGQMEAPWHPRPVIIPTDGFMEKDHDHKSYWITLAPGMAIQDLLAERNGEQRVYVVTEETPSEYHWIHDRWPRLSKVSDIREI